MQLTERHRVIYGDPAIGGDDPGGGLNTYLANPSRRTTWVAVVDGKPVGMTGLIGDGEEAVLQPAVVDEQFRCRGIGRVLVAHTVSKAKQIGIRFLSAHPAVRNIGAISFFVDNGFDIVGHVDLFQDLRHESSREWKTGITLHGKNLRY